MKDIRLIKKNATKIEVQTSEEISKELTLKFSTRPEGYTFMPTYRQGVWDGWIRFYKSNCIPIGLYHEVIKFARDKKYSIDVKFDDLLGLKKDEFIEFIKCLDLPEHFEMREYQIDAAYDCINDTKKCVKANTAAGKSLIMYYIIRFMTLEEKKSLIVVPTTSLVEQLYKDWKDYGWKSIDDYVTKIYSGKFKDYTKSVTIVTWQSLIKDLKVLKSFDTLMVDECLDGDTLIETPFGKKKIKYLKSGDDVISYNRKTKKFENDKILDVYENLNISENEDMYKLTLNDHSTIKITGNHKVLTNNGYVEVKNLTENDEIISFF